MARDVAERSREHRKRKRRGDKSVRVISVRLFIEMMVEQGRLTEDNINKTSIVQAATQEVIEEIAERWFREKPATS